MSLADQHRTLPPTGLLLLVGLSLFWGFNWPIMRIAVSEIPPLLFRTFCLGSGAMGLLLLARLGGHRLRLPRKAIGPLVLASFFNITIWNIFVAYGISMVPSGRGAILAYTMPLWGVLLGTLVLRERLSARQGLGLVFGLAGIAVLMGGELGALSLSPEGALMILGAAISWGAGTVVVKRARFTLPTTAVAGWQLLIGGIPIFILTAILDVRPAGPVSLGPILATAYNMFICFIFCYWAWFRIVGMVPVAVSGLSTLMVPVIGVFSGALLLGERIGGQELAALALVVAALATVLMPQRARRTRAATERVP